MKKINYFFSSVVLFCSINLLLVSCTKKDNPAPKPKCLITGITSSNGFNMSIGYHEDGRITTVKEGTATRTFQYAGNTIRILTEDNGALKSRGTVTLNSSGLVTNVRDTTDFSTNFWTNIAYTYSGTEVIQVKYTYAATFPQRTGAYQWANGNITETLGGANLATLQYHENEPSVDGDYFWLGSMPYYGAAIFKVKNLVKSATSGSAVQIFTYEKDGDGKILSMTINGIEVPVVYNYQYQCK